MQKNRRTWIQEIYDKVPETYRRINKNGEHVIQLHASDTPTFATLEKLSSETLQGLAKHLAGREVLHSIQVPIR